MNRILYTILRCTIIGLPSLVIIPLMYTMIRLTCINTTNKLWMLIVIWGIAVWLNTKYVELTLPISDAGGKNE